MAKSLTIPPLTEDLAQVLIDADTINRRVTELAAQINHDYRDIKEPLILIGVLKGSFKGYFSLPQRVECSII